MKQASLIVAAALAAAALPALAEDTALPAGVFVAEQTTEQYLARDNLIGAKVHGADGKIIGDIEDLIINSSNQVVGVVMGTGGVMGFGEKQVGVEIGALKFEDKDGKTSVSLTAVTPEVLGAAPAYKRTQPAKTLFERAQEKVEELSDKTSATTKDAMEKAQPMIDEAKKKAQEALDKAKEAAGPALEKAKEAVEGAIDEAKKAAEEAAKEVTPPADAPAAEAPAPEATPAPSAESSPTPPAETPAPEAAPAPPAESSPPPPAETPAQP